MSRISQFPRAAITIDKPILEESAALLEAFLGTSSVPSGVLTSPVFLHEFASFSELVNDANFAFFAPKETLASAKILDCYTQYQTWYGRLPSTLMIEGNTELEPHILLLQ